MKKYTVLVKQIYTYNGVPAKTKEEAEQKVLDFEWVGHDYCDEPLETEARIEA